MIWVAEIGSAHGGNKSLAFEMIRQAKYSGASICKFQFGWTDEAQMKYAGNINPARYVDNWAIDLATWCNHFDIELMASIWSMEGLETARRVDMKRYKVSHQVASDHDAGLLYDAIASDDKEVFVSFPVSVALTTWSNIKYLYCREAYPSYPTSTLFPEEDSFVDKCYGYSSHSHGIADALLAVARGAKYIEKHVTLDKTNPFPRDNSFAITFDEFATMVRLGDEMARLR